MSSGWISLTSRLNNALKFCINVVSWVASITTYKIIVQLLQYGESQLTVNDIHKILYKITLLWSSTGLLGWHSRSTITLKDLKWRSFTSVSVHDKRVNHLSYTQAVETYPSRIPLMFWRLMSRYTVPCWWFQTTVSTKVRLHAAMIHHPVSK